MIELLKKANELFELGNIDESLFLTEEVLKMNDKDVEALILLSKIFYKNQEWGKSLNCLNKILDIQPGNNIALNYKQMVLNILTFWNKDNYNP